MLEARGLGKRYPGVVALDGVDFGVRPGEVVALLGENGAGKSTLIKLLGGLQSPDAGEIRWNGKAVRIGSPREATHLGIAVIHQELSNLDNLDIAANVLLGREPRKLGWLIDRDAMREAARVQLRRLNLEVEPDTLVRELSIAQQQLVEIARALSMDARVLIMDEPTSSLTSAETETLLNVVKDLRAQGVGIVYVSHRLDEVKEIADRAVILRDGQRVGELSREELTTERIVRLMVGRELSSSVRSESSSSGPVCLEVDRLCTERYPRHPLTFELRQGEILGIAGLVGAGRTELVETLFGVRSPHAGSIRLNGAPIPPGSPASAIARGIFLAPEDRRQSGLITSMNVRENVTLASIPQHAAGGILSLPRETATAQTMATRLGIKAPSTESAVSGLSGGNQQKVVLAKWLSKEPKVMIFDEPTRGIDVGARAEIYRLMRDLAANGVGILMVSSDMEEILALSDRVLVMHEGRLAGELAHAEASQESIMRMAVGHA